MKKKKKKKRKRKRKRKEVNVGGAALELGVQHERNMVN